VSAVFLYIIPLFSHFIQMKGAKTKSGIVLSMTILTAIIAAAAPTILTTQSAYAFSDWCAFRSEGKAPIATSDNNVYVAWWGNGTGNFEVLFKASNDGGETFGERINLSNSTNGTSVDADVAADGNNVYVTYWDNRTGIVRAYFRASTDGGQTFGPEVALTDPAHNPVLTPEMRAQIQQKEANPDLKVAAAGDNVYVVATGDETINTPTPLEVWIRVSNDNGQTFGEPINLSNSTGIESTRAEIEASEDNVYVSWWDKVDGRDQPMMRVSNDMGQTFGEAMILTANATTPSPSPS
jgi:hypothetical protein